MTGTGDGDTRILVVEDDGLIAFDIATRLEDAGYRDVAVAATGGAEAIRQAENMRPHLVFMDITLKGDMDGIERRRSSGNASAAASFTSPHTPIRPSETGQWQRLLRDIS